MPDFSTIRFVLLIGVCLFGMGCRNRCDSDVDHSKCEDGKLYLCWGPGADISDRWELVMDCGALGASCRKGSYESQIPGSDWFSNNCIYRDCPLVYASPFTPYENDDAVWEHMCISDTHQCNGAGHLECTADNSAIVNCESKDDGPEPVIIAEKPEWYSACVVTDEGLGFAYKEGTCTDGDTYCDGAYDIVSCQNDIWSRKTTCDALSNLVCAEFGETEEQFSAGCKIAEPCDAAWREICAPRLSERHYYHCSGSTSIGSSIWDFSSCPEGTICYQVNDLEIECR